MVARLVEERTRLGISQADMAAAGDIPPRTYQDWERGVSPIKAERFVLLAAVGVDVLYVLTGQRGVDTVGLLSAEESALVDNYRHASPEHQASLRQVGSSFALMRSKARSARASCGMKSVTPRLSARWKG